MAVFIFVTVIVFGGGAFMMGQALAETWRPAWQNVPYGLLLMVFSRFIHWSLFAGSLIDPAAFALDGVVLIAIALFAYRITQVRKMVTQYPWLYERSGLFFWRARAG